jgi:hypothetical protein
MTFLREIAAGQKPGDLSASGMQKPVLHANRTLPGGTRSAKNY